MHEPPDETLQPEGRPSDEAAGQGTLKESPQETGTRPLKPLPREPEAAGKLPPASSPPPATVLRQVTDLPPEPPWEESDETGRVRLVPPVPDPPPWRLILQLVDPAPSIIGLDVRHPLLVGRADPASGRHPDLDLTPYQATRHGVSRRQAMLIPDHDHLYIADMESTNGTWVNGVRVIPGRRYALLPGDLIEFGTLRLMVRSVAQLRRSSSE